jgi:hypothetical protein
MMGGEEWTPATAPSESQDRPQRRGTRTSDAVAGGLMIIQGIVLLLLALLSLAIPHSCARGCGGGIDAVAIAAFVTGLAVLAVSGALLRGVRWARPVAFALDALLATGAAIAFAVTFAGASADDRSTYATLWAMGGVLVLLAAAPGVLMWPPRAQR